MCPLDVPPAAASASGVPDVHAGDMETAAIHHLYPGFVDTEAAKKLPAVALRDEDADKWMIGGHIHALSPAGYLGAPADFETVAAEDHLNDYAQRLYQAIGRTLPDR